MSHASITLIVFGCVVVLFISQRVAVEVVSIGAALALFATGVIDLDDAVSGFGDQTVVFIAALFVVSTGLEVSGVVSWLGRLLVRLGAGKPRRLLTVALLVVGLLSAFITPNGSVAALLPVIVVTATKVGWRSSRMLIPTAYAASAGSQLALTGSNVNVITSNAAAGAGVGHFGFFDFTLLGIPLLIGTVGIVLFLGDRLLPDRMPRTLTRDFSGHARALLDHYRQGTETFQLRLHSTSPLIGMACDDVVFSEYPSVDVRGVRQRGKGDFVPQAALSAGDTLVLQGRPEVIEQLAQDMHLYRWPGGPTQSMFDAEGGVAEVVVAPRSGLAGEKVFPGMITSAGDLVILAVHRRGEDIGTREITLEQGDVLLLQGTWESFEEIIDNRDVLVVDEPEAVRRSVAPMGARGRDALLILAGMIALLASGAVQPVVAGLIAAGAMVVRGVLSLDQAYKGISWTTVVLIAGMIPLSTAMTRSGAAEKLAHLLISVVGTASPYLLVLGLCLFTGVLGQLVSNTATALIVIPIAVSAAADAAISPRPLLMAVNVAAAAALLTPVATPANMMIMAPAGYRFGDYWRLGLPIFVLYLAVATLLVPVLFPF